MYMASWITLVALFAMTSAECLAETEGDGALFLSPLIAAGCITEAKSLSRVSWDFVNEVNHTELESYAGYITVDETYDSNMFFWFFPAKENASTAPVLLWLNGGPGISSMIGALIENGPLKVTTEGKVVESERAWTTAFSMLYIDNPVGVGYSFTAKFSNIPDAIEKMTPHLYSVLVQFFTMFPEYSQNDLYIGGQSFACQYISALGKHIHDHNHVTPPPSLFLPLKGIYLGGGFCNAALTYTEFYENMYYAGVVSDYTRRMNRVKVNSLIDKVAQTGRVDKGDIRKIVDDSYYVTGTDGLDNLLGLEHSISYLKKKLEALLTSPTARQALHVGQAHGTATFKVFTLEIWDHVRALSFFRSANEENVFLLENYKVLHYSGNMDLAVSVAATEAFLHELEWTGADCYYNSTRDLWSLDGVNLLGWVTQIGNFTRMVVRNAGHQVPHDQPEAAFLMMKYFVFDIPFLPEKNSTVEN